jgi:hypothetical protein
MPLSGIHFLDPRFRGDDKPHWEALNLAVFFLGRLLGL